MSCTYWLTRYNVVNYIAQFKARISTQIIGYFGMKNINGNGIFHFKSKLTVWVRGGFSVCCGVEEFNSYLVWLYVHVFVDSFLWSHSCVTKYICQRSINSSRNKNRLYTHMHAQG